jgi:RNA polymerase sigma-B factor
MGAGDQRGRLIEAYLPLTQHVARRYARRPEQKEELAQVGALALVRAVDRCEPDHEHLTAYLARCVDGEVRHYLRDRARVLRLPRAAEPPAIVSLDDDLPGDEGALADALLDHAVIVSAARRLDERERLIVLLVFFCDYTQAEAAAAIGISQPHVSRLLHAALRKLRRQLGPGTLSSLPEGATLRGDGDRRRQDARA